MTPEDLADLRRIAASQFMLPIMSRETLRELLAAYESVSRKHIVARPALETDAPFVARDLSDMGTTAGDIAIALHIIETALVETYVEGHPSESVCGECIKGLHTAQRGITGLIAELELEAGQ